jgi:hypothetical protein
MDKERDSAQSPPTSPQLTKPTLHNNNIVLEHRIHLISPSSDRLYSSRYGTPLRPLPRHKHRQLDCSPVDRHPYTARASPHRNTLDNFSEGIPISAPLFSHCSTSSEATQSRQSTCRIFFYSLLGPTGQPTSPLNNLFQLVQKRALRFVNSYKLCIRDTLLLPIQQEHSQTTAFHAHTNRIILQ